MTYLSLFLTVLAWTVFAPFAIFHVIFAPYVLTFAFAVRLTARDIGHAIALWLVYFMPPTVLSGSWLAIHYGVNL